MNYCQAGHKTHDRKIVNTYLGEMTIFDWEKYMDFKGYCTGQDGVSQTLEKEGYWDIDIHNLICEILGKGNKENLVIDIGCHIGYFSRLAEQLGYNVTGVDADKENLELARLNAPNAMLDHFWIDEKLAPLDINIFRKIELVKIDIEGNERFAIQYLSNYLSTIKNIIMEVSPVFNDTYPQLIHRLVHSGYEVFELDGKPFDFDFKFEQKDLWFKNSRFKR